MGMVIQPSRFTSAPVGGAHRYWRIFSIDQNGGSNHTAIGDVEMYSSALDGPARFNRAIGGTASAISNNTGETPAMAFDNSNANQWAATGATNRWLAYDFGSPIEIDRFAIRARGTMFQGQTPRNFRLEYSDDGSTWTTLFQPAAQTDWGVNEMRLFEAPSYSQTYSGSPHGAHRYWRLHFNRAQTGSTYALVECEMRATPGGADETGSGTATAHSNYSGSYDAPKAFDNNTGTLWSADGSSDNGWLQYDFGSGVTKAIAEISLTARTESNVHQTPVAGCVQFSDDGIEWSTAWSYALSNFTAEQTKTTSDPAYI